MPVGPHLTVRMRVTSPSQRRGHEVSGGAKPLFLVTAQGGPTPSYRQRLLSFRWQ
jgi:hypothetical protein